MSNTFGFGYPYDPSYYNGQQPMHPMYNEQQLMSNGQQPIFCNPCPQPTAPVVPTQAPIPPNVSPSYEWGFLFENTLFTPFDVCNNHLLEESYRQPIHAQTRFVLINDSHLSGPAKVYFGVDSSHLRMPGTRYNVVRRIIPSGPGTHFG
ncbi:hypothetical protein BC938DRAFT_473955 [Jimgerdemannia flammicorona]|uniref:Uncharacterized protein n=1 Tax=Jimgerdemannia flammicorona TaxID=994334 RepID=A0A433Q397_9FUNG|nr:hypothetical protein BC938DRAFT_473955 [Jimgerdemannia flammicorona]